MKERPILFSAPMVKAIPSGVKTQTRRVLKPQPIPQMAGRGGWEVHKNGGVFPFWDGTADVADTRHHLVCPHGQPGDRLWIRETWAINDIRHGWGRIPKVAQNFELLFRADGDWKDQFEQIDGKCPPWRPSIHMPRWASRIALEVTGVRVERLQDISDSDSIAEGVQPLDGSEPGAPDHDGRYRAAFAYLWDDLAKGDTFWCDDPWVWVIEFRKIKRGAA